MEKLIYGLKKFKEELYEKDKDYFTELAKKQNPHTLFIGCSDSRLVSNLILSTMPGELFMVRNVANIVPPYGTGGAQQGTMSAIEYAMSALEIENIIVCGHSDCGGCKALTESEASLKKMPHTYEWLSLARPAYFRVKAAEGTDNPNSVKVEKMNVILQREHLFTYPDIAARVEAGTLKVYGWYYDIGHGSVENYNPLTGEFEKIV